MRPRLPALQATLAPTRAAVAILAVALSLLAGTPRADSLSHQSASSQASRSTSTSDANPSPTSTALPRTRVGVAYGDTLTWMTDARLAATLDDAVALGARWVRADLSWTNIQYDGPDQWLWHRFDRVLDAAQTRGLRVLPTLAYSPPWAKDAGCTAFACPPADPDAFARFAREAAARYAPRGIRAWEIWNEQNTPTFWTSPSPDRYATLLARTTRAIRSQDPRAKVILGGLASVRTADGNIDAREFLDRVCAAGACRGISGVAFHPYTFPHLASYEAPWGTPWNTMNRTPVSLRTVLRDHGRPRLKVWVTEYGAPTGGPGTPSDGSPGTITPATTHVTEERQAEIAADVVHTAVTSPDVAALMWYTDRDNPRYLYKVDHYGLRRADGSRKPAWEAFRSALSQHAARTR